MKIEGYEIVGELYSNPSGLKVYEATDKKGVLVQIRIADYSHNKNGLSIDDWYKTYEHYQLTITNYKNLPRVSVITMINDSKVYTVVDCEKGEVLKKVGTISLDGIPQLIDAVRHLHRKKSFMDSYAENIWLTKKEESFYMEQVK